jgi:hypothetical protein
MVEVVVDATTLSKSRSGSIPGVVFLRTASGEYPEAQWSDFPVVVLAWWIQGLAELIAGREPLFTGYFMDGPFSFTVRLVAAGTAEVLWRKGEHPQGSQVTDVRSLMVSAAVAGSVVAEACRRNGWSTRDTQALEHALAKAAA